MDAEDRPSVHPVIRRLRERPEEFAFFQAIRLIELANPDAVSLGRQGPARREAVRLRPSSSLTFQAGELTKFEMIADSVERVTTTIFGLYGANSPLPAFYSTDILEYETENAGEDDPVRLFLDVINHRLLSLLYRAWSKYRWAFTFRLDLQDDISRAAFALCGIAEFSQIDKLDVPAQRLLGYSGLRTQRPVNARSLERAISDYFDEVPAQIIQCVENWVSIHPSDRSRLGMHNVGLGENFVIGESILDRAGKFRIEIGPLESLDAFERFTLGGVDLRELAGFVRFILDEPLEFDILVGLVHDAVPLICLSPGSDAPRLGATSWLCSEPAAADKWEYVSPPRLGLAA